MSRSCTTCRRSIEFLVDWFTKFELERWFFTHFVSMRIMPRLWSFDYQIMVRIPYDVGILRLWHDDCDIITSAEILGHRLREIGISELCAMSQLLLGQDVIAHSGASCLCTVEMTRSPDILLDKNNDQSAFSLCLSSQSTGSSSWFFESQQCSLSVRLSNLDILHLFTPK